MIHARHVHDCMHIVHKESTRSQSEVTARLNESLKTASLESGVHGWAAFIKKRQSSVTSCRRELRKRPPKIHDQLAVQDKLANQRLAALKQKYALCIKTCQLKHRQLYRYQLGDCPRLVFQCLVCQLLEFHLRFLHSVSCRSSFGELGSRYAI